MSEDEPRRPRRAWQSDEDTSSPTSMDDTSGDDIFRPRRGSAEDPAAFALGDEPAAPLGDTPIPAPVFPHSAGEYADSPSPAPRRSALSSLTPVEADQATPAARPQAPRPGLARWVVGGVAGALVVVPAFNIILPDPSVLGGDEWPAPSCVVWAGVSQAFSGGLSALVPSARTAIVVGLALGVALALMEKLAPKRLLPFIPSPSGLGIAMVIPASNCIAMFLGAAIAEWLRRTRPALAEKTVVPVSSGLIAGESLMGIVIALLIVAGVLSK